MKSDYVFEKIEEIIARLNDGEKVDKGEFKVVWDFASILLFEFLEQKENAEMPVNDDVIDMVDKLVQYVEALLEHSGQVFGEKKENTAPHPTTVPQSAPFVIPPAFVPDPLYGWRFNDGTGGNTNLNPGYSYSTSPDYGKR